MSHPENKVTCYVEQYYFRPAPLSTSLPLPTLTCLVDVEWVADDLS